jgi:hypothetical protein
VQTDLKKLAFDLLSSGQEAPGRKWIWQVDGEALNRLCVVAGFSGGIPDAQRAMSAEAIDSIMAELDRR